VPSPVEEAKVVASCLDLAMIELIVCDEWVRGVCEVVASCSVPGSTMAGPTPNMVKSESAIVCSASSRSALSAREAWGSTRGEGGASLCALLRLACSVVDVLLSSSPLL